MIKTIAFDADDTLWHTQRLFELTTEKMVDLLSPYHEKDWIRRHLGEAEIRNLDIYGYGVKGFILSVVETAIELTEGRITGAEIEKIMVIGRRMLAEPIELLAGVQKTVQAVQGKATLMIVTKGDLLEQEEKVARSGLGDLFDYVEVLSKKNPENYLDLFHRYKIDPASFVMIGNSLRSDIIPVVQAGGKAIYIPQQNEWSHELVSDEEANRHHFITAKTISEVPSLLEQL